LKHIMGAQVVEHRENASLIRCTFKCTFEKGGKEDLYDESHEVNVWFPNSTLTIDGEAVFVQEWIIESREEEIRKTRVGVKTCELLVV